MSNPKFTPGCIVRLRSGGPTMSVGYIYNGILGTFGPTSQNGYDCFWFDDEKHLQRNVFSEEILESPEEPKMPMRPRTLDPAKWGS